MGTAMCAIAETLDTQVASSGKKACGTGACSGMCKRFAAPAGVPAKAAEPAADQFPLAIPSKLAAEILKPYRQNATYLKSAEITQVCDKSTIAPGTQDQRLVTGKGCFAIPESCYIDDTGHFNAVEFNICYNQLAYVLFAGCIEAGLMHKVRAGDVEIPSMTEFKRH